MEYSELSKLYETIKQKNKAGTQSSIILPLTRLLASCETRLEALKEMPAEVSQELIEELESLKELSNYKKLYTEEDRLRQEEIEKQIHANSETEINQIIELKSKIEEMIKQIKEKQNRDETNNNKNTEELSVNKPEPSVKKTVIVKKVEKTVGSMEQTTTQKQDENTSTSTIIPNTNSKNQRKKVEVKRVDKNAPLNKNGTPQEFEPEFSNERLTPIVETSSIETENPKQQNNEPDITSVSDASNVETQTNANESERKNSIVIEVEEAPIVEKTRKKYKLKDFIKKIKTFFVEPINKEATEKRTKQNQKNIDELSVIFGSGANTFVNESEGINIDIPLEFENSQGGRRK